MHMSDQILARMRSHSPLLCAGLDPDIRKLLIEALDEIINETQLDYVLATTKPLLTPRT